MCPSVIDSNKPSIPSAQSRLTAFKKLNWKHKLFIWLLICSITTILIYQHGNNFFEQMTSSLRGGGLGELSQQEIIILQWTPFWERVFPPTLFNSDTCSILKTATTQRSPISRIFDKPLTITYDHQYLSDSHAVVFHSPDLYYWPPSSNLPNGLRPQNQIWVWYQAESPLISGFNPTAYNHIFNWTMSYRRDSDVYYPYGYIVPRNNTISPRPSDLDNPTDHHRNRKPIEMKSGLAAWIVSSCDTPSKREIFVKELQKYIQVDVFGKCGPMKCQAQVEGFYPCYNHIQSKYKFYLSFENSLCGDYITEKFYLALQTSMLPVVYGGGIDDRMDYLGIAPENSFIDARKFKSPKNLANYLIYLDNNYDEYLKYFEWKDKYQVVYKDHGQNGLGWCLLCQRIYEQQIQSEGQPLSNKWYSDLHSWWNYARVSENLQGLNTPQLELTGSHVSPVGQSFHYSVEKLQPACVLNPENFTSYGKYYKSN